MAASPYVPSPGANPAAAARVTKAAAPAPARLPGGKQPAPKPPVKPQDPYADPQAYIRNAVSQLGTPMSDADIQANAQSQLAPLIAALQASIRAQALSGTNAIQGYTSNLAQHLAGYQQNAQNIYGGAEQAQAASDAALSARLTGGGDQEAQDLGAKLASINAPGATNAAVQGASQTALGSGNALYATGGASLANLIASGAAEQSYAGKLPGLAGLAGAQQVGNLQGELAKSLADQTGTLQAKVPDIVTGLEGQRSDLLNRQATLTQNLNSFFSDRQLRQQGLNQDQKAKQDALKQERQALGLPDPSLSGKVGVVVDKRGNPVRGKDGKPQLLPGYHTNAGGSVVKDTKPKGAPKPRTVDNSLSKAYGFLVDSSGNPLLKNGQRQTLPKAATTASQKANSALSKSFGYLVDGSGNPILKNGKRVMLPSQPAKGDSVTVQRWTAQALAGARAAHAGTTDGKNVYHPPLSWQQFLTEGLSEGIPAQYLIKQGKRVYTQAEIKQGLIPKGKK